MSSRMFQNVILQMKEATDRRIGVIDADGSVVSCTDSSVVGEKWAECIIRLSGADEAVVHFGGMTLRPLTGDGAHFEFAVFVDGEDAQASVLYGQGTVERLFSVTRYLRYGLLAIVGLAAIREKIAYSNIPPALRGVGITFIITGLMGIAFMSFMGIKL